MAEVLFPSANYGAAFVAPRAPRTHRLVWDRHPPDLHRYWRPLDGLALRRPGRSFDLMHTFNGVPLTSRPFVVTYESALPRTYGRGRYTAQRLLRDRLLRDNCRSVIAISEYARRRMRTFNAGWADLDAVEARTEVVHPNLPLRRTTPKTWDGKRVDLLFVGRQWARKGGVVAVRIARKARERGLPVHVTIVSPLVHGSAVYTDAPDADYAADRALLDAPNVTVHERLPNDEVVALMAASTLTLLATVHDTYGFSVLEGFSTGTPAVASRIGALPEVVQHGVNGLLLDAPLDADGDWTRVHDRTWDALDPVYESFADQAIEGIEALLAAPERYEAMSAAAIARIRDHHEADAVGARLEEIYSRALA